MILYRKRALLSHLITFVFALSIGYIITVSVVNVENCQPEQDRLQSKPGHNLTSNSIFLVIIILSAPENTLQRNIIRQTWLNWQPRIDDSSYFDASHLEFDRNGFLQQDTIYQQSSSLDAFKQKMTKEKFKPLKKYLDLNIVHYFAIGNENLPFLKSNRLVKEHSKHNDLLILNDLGDSYANLTLKLLKTFHAVSNMQSFEYLLKTDDDTYVKLDYLIEDLYEYDGSIRRKQSTSNSIKPELYWGYFNGRANIKTQGQWKESNFNLCERYLPYALGGGYVISKNLVQYIAQNHRSLNRYVSEDISMGVWLSPLRNVYRKHDPRFDTAYMPRKCQNYHIVLHKRSTEVMRDLYRGFLCTFKQANDTSLHRPAEYFYDWSRSQTQCCDNLVDQY